MFLVRSWWQVDKKELMNNPGFLCKTNRKMQKCLINIGEWAKEKQDSEEKAIFATFNFPSQTSPTDPIYRLKLWTQCSQMSLRFFPWLSNFSTVIIVLKGCQNKQMDSRKNFAKSFHRGALRGTWEGWFAPTFLNKQ